MIDETEPNRVKRLAAELTSEVQRLINEKVSSVPLRMRKDFMEELHYDMGQLLCNIAAFTDSLTETRAPLRVRKKAYEAGLLASYLDHKFYARSDECPDEYYLVAEPYAMGMEDFERLISDCKRNDTKFIAGGFSKHFPGRTFRVIVPLFKKKELTIDG